MRACIQQLHIYLSLFSFTSLVVFGLVGLHATFEPGFEDRPKAEARRWEMAFATPKNLDDVELAERIRKEFASALANPVAKQFLKRTSEGRLQVDFFEVNGLTRVVVFDDKLTFEQTRVPVLEYLNRIHATTTRAPVTDLRVRAWIWYNELAIWSLLGMTVTGILLWLTMRLSHRGALVAAVLGSAGFALIYWRLH